MSAPGRPQALIPEPHGGEGTPLSAPGRPQALIPEPHGGEGTPVSKGLSAGAFATLMLVACMFGGNHVAARIAFDHGLDIVTAVTFRSLGTALVVGLLVWQVRVALVFTARQRRVLPLIGLLVAVQSLCIYSAVARMPVALALLAFNSYPMWAALWSRWLYGQRTDARALRAMPVLLVGLALALDVTGAASGLGARGQWAQIGAGTALAVAAAAVFGVVLALTQHEVATLDGRLRTAITMAMVGALALAAMAAQGGPQLPADRTGWWALVALTALYGTAFTITFTLLPRIGVVGNSPLLNVEPVAALVMGWLLLDQAMAPVQVAGSLLVVATVMALGWPRRR